MSNPLIEALLFPFWVLKDVMKDGYRKFKEDSDTYDRGFEATMRVVRVSPQCLKERITTKNPFRKLTKDQRYALIDILSLGAAADIFINWKYYALPANSIQGIFMDETLIIAGVIYLCAGIILSYFLVRDKIKRMKR